MKNGVQEEYQAEVYHQSPFRRPVTSIDSDSDELPPVESVMSKSLCNEVECDIVYILLETIRRSYSAMNLAGSVSMVTPYREQARYIQGVLHLPMAQSEQNDVNMGSTPPFKDVAVRTIDSM